MRLHLELWVLGFILVLWKRAWEVRARYYLRFDLWFKQHRIEITLYKRDMPDSGLLFHIHFPLIELHNDMMMEAVSFGADLKYHAVPVITGKILWKEIKHAQKPKGK